MERNVFTCSCAALAFLFIACLLSAEEHHDGQSRDREGADTSAPTYGRVVQQAISKIQAQDYRSARDLLQTALRRSPQAVELWDLLGIAETESKNTEAADRAFRRGLQLAPKSTSLNENAGLLYFREAKYNEAKKYLTHAVQTGSNKPGVLFSLAASELRTGQVAEALARLTSLEPSLGERPEYWEERGRAELPGDPIKAENSFGQALERAPRSLAALNGAASAAEKQGLDEKALAYLIKARAAGPEDVPTLAHFATVCIRRDLGPDALEALETARRLDPSNPDLAYLLGRANISVGNWQKAYDLFDEFARRHPTFAPAYYAMGWLDVKLNRVDQARRQLDQALQLAPHMANARYELAQLAFDDGQLEEAERQLRIVLRDEPHHAKANVTMGDILLRKGDLAGARRHLETAVADNPKLAAAHYKLSILYARQHEGEKAAAEKALAADLSAEANRASKVQMKLVLPEAGREP